MLEILTAMMLMLPPEGESAPKTLGSAMFGYVGDLDAFSSQSTVTLSEFSQEAINLYEKLPLTAEEREKIAEILMTMADNNVFSLLFDKRRLTRLGQEVHHVHPLRFLGVVFKDPRLIHAMYQIRNNRFKWNGFMDGDGTLDGFSERLKTEIRMRNVEDYLPGFADFLNINVHDVQFYIKQQNTEGLVLFLMEKSRR